MRPTCSSTSGSNTAMTRIGTGFAGFARGSMTQSMAKLDNFLYGTRANLCQKIYSAELSTVDG
jgi:hypothetical protein